MSNPDFEARLEAYIAQVREAVAAGLATARRALVDAGRTEAEADAEVSAFPVESYVVGIRQRLIRLGAGREPGSRRIVAHASLADAMLDLHGQIVDRYGDHPDTLEDLTIQTLPCPQEGSDRRGTVLAAYPRTGINADHSNLLTAYFGDVPQPSKTEAGR